MEDILQAEPYDSPLNLLTTKMDMKKPPQSSTAKPKATTEKRTREPSAYNMYQKIEMGRLGGEFSGRDKLSRVARMWSEVPDLEKSKMKEFLKTNMQILAVKAPDPKQRFELITDLWIEMH